MSRHRTYSVYLLANGRQTVFYVGVTNDLARRMAEHRAVSDGSFVARYNVRRLMHVEHYDTAVDAIAREKQLKRWRRDWKRDLIREHNPSMRDLWDDATRPW